MCNYHTGSKIYIPLISECEVCTASYGQSFFLPFMAQVRSTWAMKTIRKEKWGSITCCTDRANKANKMYIIWLFWLFQFWKGYQELEVRTATYKPGIDQSHYVKSVSHIIMGHIVYSRLRYTQLCIIVVLTYPNLLKFTGCFQKPRYLLIIF